jgi:predicted RNA-binding Zn-ribbon protein involved in translation (DUF1610 family)
MVKKKSQTEGWSDIIKNQKSKVAKSLDFVCPNCGCKRLECCEANAYVTSIITNLSDNGDFSYGSPIIEDSEVLAFQCVDCGFRPTDKSGQDINDNVELVKWLKKQNK